MEFEITSDPSYATLRLTLDEGEQLGARPGAMLSRSSAITVETDLGGDDGLVGMAKRVASDERALTSNTFYSRRDGAALALVPEEPGDVTPINVGREGPLRVQSGAVLGWEPLVEKQTALNAAQNMFSSGELTVLSLSGQGWAFLSACGGIETETIEPGDPLVVDEDHLVAWTDGLGLTRRNDGGLTTTVLGGEGRVTELSGSGTVWLQTRNPLVFRHTQGGG